MRVFISQAFATAISNRSAEEMQIFNEKIDVLKNMSYQEIIESDEIMELVDEKKIVIYAYNTQESVYVLFTFKEKSKIVLLDEIEFIGDEIKSLAYTDLFTQDKKDGGENQTDKS